MKSSRWLVHIFEFTLKSKFSCWSRNPPQVPCRSNGKSMRMGQRNNLLHKCYHMCTGIHMLLSSNRSLLHRVESGIHILMNRSWNIDQLDKCSVLGGNHKFLCPSIHLQHIHRVHRGTHMKHGQNSSHHCKNFTGLQHRCKSKFQRRRLSKKLHCCSQ